MYEVTTTEAFLTLITDGVDELDEIIACAEEDIEEELVNYIPIYQHLLEGFKQLRESIRNGETCPGGGEDLVFIEQVHRARPVIPFAGLLLAINRVHRDGFDHEVLDPST